MPQNSENCDPHVILNVLQSLAQAQAGPQSVGIIICRSGPLPGLAGCMIQLLLPPTSPLVTPVGGGPNGELDKGSQKESCLRIERFYHMFLTLCSTVLTRHLVACVYTYMQQSMFTSQNNIDLKAQSSILLESSPDSSVSESRLYRHQNTGRPQASSPPTTKDHQEPPWTTLVTSKAIDVCWKCQAILF